MHPFGTPIPPHSEHAVSVSMPAWQDVVDYEEGTARAVSTMRNGYPRFFYHHRIKELCARVLAHQGRAGEDCLLFSSAKAAALCIEFMRARRAATRQSELKEAQGLQAVFFPKDAASVAKEFWQHAGLGISSRRAEDALNGTPPIDASAQKQQIRGQLAQLAGHGVRAEDVLLYPCGMAAIFAAHQLACARRPGARTVQLGFPYVDTLKIQQKFGAGCHYLPTIDLGALEALFAREEIAAVFCEFPGNPLLASVDMKALSALCRANGALLVIDDTFSTVFNADCIAHADMLVTSLTKFHSGIGDVMAGSLIVSPASPRHAELNAELRASHEDLLYGADARVLAGNMADFDSRMPRINANAEALADFLHGHPAVAQVYYPKYVTPETYLRYKKPGGGYGGILSFVLRNPAHASAVYDALEVAKGPSLGCNYTLACPYTLLAHYRELDFAAASGVESSLIRVSVGIEEAQTCIALFEKALRAA